MNNFITTDETEDVAGSVRHTLRCWEFTNEDSHAWKWVILSLHSALQGACVCHLLTTANPIGVVTKDNEREWIDYFEQSRSDSSITRPRTKLLSLPELLKKV